MRHGGERQEPGEHGEPVEDTQVSPRRKRGEESEGEPAVLPQRHPADEVSHGGAERQRQER